MLNKNVAILLVITQMSISCLSESFAAIEVRVAHENQVLDMKNCFSLLANIYFEDELNCCIKLKDPLLKIKQNQKINFKDIEKLPKEIILKKDADLIKNFNGYNINYKKENKRWHATDDMVENNIIDNSFINYLNILFFDYPVKDKKFKILGSYFVMNSVISIEEEAMTLKVFYHDSDIEKNAKINIAKYIILLQKNNSQNNKEKLALVYNEKNLDKTSVNTLVFGIVSDNNKIDNKYLRKAMDELEFLIENKINSNIEYKNVNIKLFSSYDWSM